MSVRLVRNVDQSALWRLWRAVGGLKKRDTRNEKREQECTLMS